MNLALRPRLRDVEQESVRHLHLSENGKRPLLRRLKVMGSVTSDFKPAGGKKIRKSAEPACERDSSTPRPSALLSSILESSSDAILSRDLKGTVTTWNQAACRLFGYTTEEMVGQSLLRLIPSDLHFEHDEVLATVSRGERVEGLETVRVKKSGDRFPVYCTVAPILDESGIVVGAAEIVRDISDLRRSEEDRFLFAAIIGSSEDAILSTDLKGNVRSWNQAAFEMFGYTSEEMLSESALKIVPAEHQSREMEILRRLSWGEKIERFEAARVRKDGQIVEVSVTISPLKDARGRIVGSATIAHDISERKRIERMLIRSEKLAATGRMAATVAHEINNPLESVLNFVYLARRNSPPHEKAHSYLLSAEGELDRVSQIIRRVLGYYSETGRHDEVFLHEILAEALAVYQAQLHASGISVDCRYEDHHRIGVHWNEFAQVFSTLLADSIQVLPPGGSLRFDLEDARTAEQEGVQVTARLRAPGMQRDVLERAFEPLAAVQGRISSSVGLSMARELLEKRGAQVTFSCTSSSEVADASICIFVPFV
jgi:PAS domain S-box-containing protein